MDDEISSTTLKKIHDTKDDFIQCKNKNRSLIGNSMRSGRNEQSGQSNTVTQ